MSTWRPKSRDPLWKRVLPGFLHGPVKVMFQLGVLGVIIASAVAFFYFLLASRYDLDEVAKLPVGTQFLDRHGKELSVPGASARRLAKREDLPDFLVKALQAREDAKFFEHPGIDVKGLIRATARNIKDRKYTQGASTLTMQLAKNTFENTEKSIHRKLLEIALTLRIERRYSKDEILTHYLNRIYFGAGAYGIEQAAETYFGKAARELSDAECALVVGIIRGPHAFSPLRDPEAAIEQRRQTLLRMETMGFVSAERREALEKQPLKLAENHADPSQASYALQAVRAELDRVLNDEQLRAGGVVVKTTLDAAWQERLETELNTAVRSLEAEKGWPHPTHADYQPSKNGPGYVQFAAVTTETKTGAVLALIGGRDFRHSRLDRSRSERDLGSAIEPFIAAAVSERGKLVLPGKPLQMGRQIGPQEVARIAKRLGLAGPFADSEDLFRGYLAASPRDAATALATIGNDGKRPRLFFIREVKSLTGELLFTGKADHTQAIGGNAAKDAGSILKSTAGTKCLTGSTSSERDAWTLRLGPSGATAIWIGFDQPAPIASEARLASLISEFVKRLGND